MKLYHTSDREIREPDIRHGRANADFGQGFYLASSADFAGSWARERTDADIVVNVYDLDTQSIRVRVLEKNEEWLRFILDNRRGRNPENLFDVIIGPVASDTLFETFGIITSGLISEEQALELLQIGPDFTQAAVRTEEGAAHLRWIDSYVLDSASIKKALENYERERELFDNDFAEALNSMDIE